MFSAPDLKSMGTGWNPLSASKIEPSISRFSYTFYVYFEIKQYPTPLLLFVHRPHSEFWMTTKKSQHIGNFYIFYRLTWHFTSEKFNIFLHGFLGFEEALPNGTKMRHDFVLPINYYTLQFSSAYSVDSRIHLPHLLTYS